VDAVNTLPTTTYCRMSTAGTGAMDVLRFLGSCEELQQE
jgi:hypothetical protein